MTATEEEQNNADKIMELVGRLKKHAIEDLLLLNESLPNDENKKPQKRIALAEETKNRLKELQKQLQITEKPALTETEKNELKVCEDETVASLNQLDDIIQGLYKELELVEESFKRQDAINKCIVEAETDLFKISKKYEMPQKLLNAEDDIRKAETLGKKIGMAEDQLKNHKQWVQKSLVKNEDVNEASRLAEEKINDQKRELAKLITSLRNDVDSTKRLEMEKDRVVKEFNLIADKAKEVHSLSDNDQKTNQLLVLKKETELLQETLEQLRNNAVQNSQMLVTQIDSLELEPVLENLEELSKLLNNEAKDVTRKLINNAAESKISNKMQIIENAIQKAANVDNDENGTEEDMQLALSTLNNSNSEFTKIEETCNTLNADDSECNLIRNGALERLSKLGEKANALAQSIKDRLETLNDFTKLSNEIESELEEIQQIISEERAQNSTPAAWENVAAQSEELSKRILTLADYVVNLSPLNQPKLQCENLTNRQKKLAEHAKAAQTAAIAKETLQNEIDEYTKKLNEFKISLHAAKQKQEDLPKMTSNEIEKIQNLTIRPLQKMLSGLQEKEAPTANLEEEKNLLAKNLLLLQHDIELLRKGTFEQENLAQNLEKNITDYETELANMISRYKNSQSLSVAEDDINVLKPIKEAIVALPLADIKDKTICEMLLKRLQPVHVDANVS